MDDTFSAKRGKEKRIHVVVDPDPESWEGNYRWPLTARVAGSYAIFGPVTRPKTMAI